jgi:Asp-tRNA(Asn)/Glu-tRNA(Gln) amidotransferase A subunit family amidase
MNQSRMISELTAVEAREHLVSGRAGVEEFCAELGRFIDAADRQVKAFAHRDDRVVALQAEHLLKQRAAGELPGALYGVPVAVKDIIDTVDYPTEYGSPIHAGRYAVADATVVARLRAAGAVVFGKTVTTEFATFHPGPTCNPHDIEHTPGGSSSGSAAAVAAGLVPIALGSQTNGSVIRPASYCGVYAFKPSLGLLPRSGVLDQSPSLDQLGVFARNIDDLALAAEVMSGDDGQDRASAGQFPRRLYDVAVAEPPLQPKFCFVQTPWWSEVEPEAQEAYEALIEHLGDIVERAALPEIVTRAVDWHAQVNLPELAFCLQKEWNGSRDRLSESLRDRIEKGMAVPVMDYLAAKDRMAHVTHAFDEYFTVYDAILCPAALGAAPKGLASTGNPIMQTVWSFAGLPSLNLPLLNLSNGLPLGLQAIGAYGNDARLLRSARWLVAEFVKRNQA